MNAFGADTTAHDTDIIRSKRNISENLRTHEASRHMVEPVWIDARNGESNAHRLCEGQWYLHHVRIFREPNGR